MSSSKGFGQGTGFGGKSSSGGTRKPREVPYKNPHPDPLAEIEYTESFEENAKAELDAIQAVFRARVKAEKSRFDFAVDADFWSGICFKSRDDRTAFLEAIGLDRLYRGRHIDGYELARVLGLDIDWPDGPNR